jgi:hypothetical protein
MKFPEFVELPVYTYHEGDGWWREYNAINTSEILTISPDKNYTKIIFKNGKDCIITLSYTDTILRLNQ